PFLALSGRAANIKSRPFTVAPLTEDVVQNQADPGAHTACSAKTRGPLTRADIYYAIETSLLVCSQKESRTIRECVSERFDVEQAGRHSVRPADRPQRGVHFTHAIHLGCCTNERIGVADFVCRVRL